METGRPPFRTDLEGLRGIAILLVVLFHAAVPGFGGGFVGVDVFFVLSGYFITRSLDREVEDTGSIDLNVFWGRRMLRLSPSLLIVIAATLGIAFTLYAPIDRQGVAGFARHVSVYAGNVSLASSARDYFSTTDNPLLHTWSLAVEEQFYLIWPFALLVPALYFSKGVSGRPQGTRMIVCIVALASFAGSTMITAESQPSAFYGVLTRVWEFAIGALVALSVRQGPSARTGGVLQWAGVIMIAAAAIRYDDGTPYPGYHAALPALGTALVIVGGMRELAGTLGMLISSGPLRWLGRVSYGWYLWHWPLVGLGGVLDPQIGAPGKVAWSVVALGLAWLTYRYVENGSVNRTLSRIPADRLALAGVGASIVMLAVAHFAMQAAEGSVASGPQARFAEARVDRKKHDCWAETVKDLGKACEFGDRTSTRVVALLGDSHAEHWLGALDRAGKERGWKVVARVKGGCPVSDAPEMTHPRRVRHYRECARYREGSIQAIIRMRPDVVLLSSWDHYLASEGRMRSWQVTPAQWEAGLRRTYKRFTDAGLRVAVMRDVPQTPFDVPQCLSRRAARLAFAGDCTYDRARSLMPAARMAQNRAATGLRVRFVDMNDVICPAKRCSSIQGGHIVFTDDNHITASYSRSLAPALADRLGLMREPTERVWTGR